MPRPDVREQRIPQLLSAAASVFAEHGFEDGSMSMVAERSGFSKATVYHYFRTKDELIGALARWVLEPDLRELARSAEKACSVRRAVADYVERLARNVSEDPETYRLVVFIYARALRSPATKGLLSAVFDEYCGILQRLFEDGIGKGRLQATVDASALASSLVATIEGSLLLSRVIGRDPAEALRRDVLAYLDAVIPGQE